MKASELIDALGADPDAGVYILDADTGKYLPVHVGINDDILFGKREPPQSAVILHGPPAPHVRLRETNGSALDDVRSSEFDPHRKSGTYRAALQLLSSLRVTADAARLTTFQLRPAQIYAQWPLA